MDGVFGVDHVAVEAVEAVNHEEEVDVGGETGLDAPNVGEERFVGDVSRKLVGRTACAACQREGQAKGRELDAHEDEPRSLLDRNLVPRAERNKLLSIVLPASIADPRPLNRSLRNILGNVVRDLEPALALDHLNVQSLDDRLPDRRLPLRASVRGGAFCDGGRRSPEFSFTAPRMPRQGEPVLI